MRDLSDPTDERDAEAEARQREAAERRAREQEDADTKALMGTKQGRRTAWRLLDKSGWRSSSFSTNAMQMAFNEGARARAQELHDLILVLCPEQFILMLQEHERDRNSDARQ